METRSTTEDQETALRKKAYLIPNNEYGQRLLIHQVSHAAETEKLFSSRETEIIQLLIEGSNSRRIGEKLFISHETVRTHRKNILKKAGLHSTAQLLTYALTHGLI